MKLWYYICTSMKSEDRKKIFNNLLQVMEKIKYWNTFLSNYTCILHYYLIWGFPHAMKLFMKWKNQTILYFVNEQFTYLFHLVQSFIVRVTHNGNVK